MLGSVSVLSASFGTPLFVRGMTHVKNKFGPVLDSLKRRQGSHPSGAGSVLKGSMSNQAAQTTDQETYSIGLKLHPACIAFLEAIPKLSGFEQDCVAQVLNEQKLLEPV